MEHLCSIYHLNYRWFSQSNGVYAVEIVWDESRHANCQLLIQLISDTQNTVCQQRILGAQVAESEWKNTHTQHCMSTTKPSQTNKNRTERTRANSMTTINIEKKIIRALRKYTNWFVYSSIHSINCNRWLWIDNTIYIYIMLEFIFIIIIIECSMPITKLLIIMCCDIWNIISYVLYAYVYSIIGVLCAGQTLASVCIAGGTNLHWTGHWHIQSGCLCACACMSLFPLWIAVSQCLHLFGWRTDKMPYCLFGQ